jgi:hypothetical protein
MLIIYWMRMSCDQKGSIARNKISHSHFLGLHRARGSRKPRGRSKPRGRLNIVEVKASKTKGIIITVEWLIEIFFQGLLRF